MKSSIVPPIYDPAIADEDRSISTEDAYAMTRRAAAEEGILIGISAGSALVGALDVARSARPGSVVVTIFPDSADKYLSENFWDDAASATREA